MKIWTKCFLIFLMGILVFHISCREETKVVKTISVGFEKEGELTIIKAKTDSIVAQLDIEIADSEYETQTGLMYRANMEENQGMLFVFPDVALHSFYMKNTQLSLDILFIDNNLQLVSFHENTVPFSEAGISSKVPVQYVLEINAGLIKKWGLEIGDRVTYTK